MNYVFEGKKIVILGGTPQHCKIVNAAKELGVYTIVIDYLKDSPAKKISDKSYLVDIKDVKKITEICKNENVDGIISGYIDPCQRPYNELCNRLGLFCYGTKDQFYKMTDKHAFKKMCMENNVDTIKEYTEEDVINNKVEYPVFVKPVDSRGSRGQSVCYNKTELINAIENAKKESSNNDFIIEKYIKNGNEFQVTYFFVNGEPYLLRTTDSYQGLEKNHLEKVVACAVSPSRFTDLFLKNANENVIKMFKKLGIKNGPIFMQGFEDNGKFRFFDPGLRFPGVDYEKIYKKVFNIDLMKEMIYIAITGKCSNVILPKDGVFLNGQYAAIYFPTVKAGIINKIDGISNITTREDVISYLPRCSVNDEILWTYNVNQRFAEIDVLSKNKEELKDTINEIQKALDIRDINNNDMKYELFDVNRII